MSTSKSRLGYVDCFELFDKALNANKGVRINNLDAGSSWRLRLRLNKARRIDRIDNTETYPEGHLLYGRSLYDKIVITRAQDEDGWYLELIKVEGIVYDVEEIKEAAE